MIEKGFVKLFYDMLELSEIKDQKILDNFWYSIHKYLSHGRKDKEEINGRTLIYVKTQLEKLLTLLDCMGFTKEETIQMITNLPTIINMVDELYKKYLFLGIIENEENSVRHEKFITKTKDLMIGFTKMYARYKMICESGYNRPTWSNILHASDNEFLKIFIKQKYYHDYQLFNNIEEATNWLNNVQVDDFDFELAKSWEVNKEFVTKYESRRKK